MIPTFRPWTHTSDDSYTYQLSLVVATATVSFDSFLMFCHHSLTDSILHLRCFVCGSTGTDLLEHFVRFIYDVRHFVSAAVKTTL